MLPRGQTGRMRRLISVLVPLSCILVGACSSASPASSRPTPPLSPHSAPHSATAPGPTGQRASGFTPWWTYHRTPSRSGHTTQPPGTLAPAWTKGLGAAVYGEPLVVGRSLIAATEGNQVVSMNAAHGTHAVVGLPRDAAAHERSALRRHRPSGHHRHSGVRRRAPARSSPSPRPAAGTTPCGRINAANGHKRWHRSLDVLPHRNRKAEQERSAVLVEHGRVVVSFGGLAGDCDNYVGYVTSTSVTGAGRTFHYAVPTQREAGMWGTPGPVLGRNGDVYVASGNGAELHGRGTRATR